MSHRHPTLLQPYSERAKTASHPLSRYLFRLMDLKASNLCLSADVTTARELLTLADKVGPAIVVLKTHYDLISGWDYNPHAGTGAKLAALARKHGFLIFEDRKFVDIGKTVQMQYTAGTARIIEWAHITNANIDAGKDMVRAMAEAAANWKAHIHYEVKTSVSVGTPVADQFESDADRDADGRKGSIVSITTVTQSFEPADSPRLAKTNEAGDDLVFPGIEEAPIERGLLLLAQMSSKGCLMTKEYTQACVEAARENKGFVMGYVAQQSLNSAADDTFIHMTPGCKLPPSDEEENGVIQGDGLGQQYNTPDKLINVLGTDICDRKLPCTNCVSRNKQSSCRYETGAYPTISRLDPPPPQPTTTTTTGTAAATENNTTSTSTEIALNTFGYTQGSTNTLNFLRQLEDAATSTSPSPTTNSASSTVAPFISLTQLPLDHFPSSPSIDQKYKSLLRQLPPKIYIQKLIPIYIREFSWAYATIDIPHFYSQLNTFHTLSFAQLSSPATVPPDLRAFPALLFQMCAVALLTLPAERGEDTEFDGLKYAGGMSFEDLAGEYTELGVQVLQILGKRGMSLTTVLAGFVRGSYLKYQALVTESWHAIGGAIRDAMEIGLHSPHNNVHGDRGKRVWMTLVVWDVHMACVLGRPTTIGLDLIKEGIALPKDDRESESSPPTPLTRALWGYKVMAPMREILELERIQGNNGGGAAGLDEEFYARIEKLHLECVRLAKEMPACFRPENPDTTWDKVADCYWLPAARVLMPQIMSFELMALHRPYIFTRQESRREALKASLEMLGAQRLHFSMLKANMYKTFSLFFGTFDAIVLLATIYILFPKEHPSLLQPALQHFQWAVERFEAMSVRNSLAKAALGVLHAIRLRLDRSLGLSGLSLSVNANKQMLPSESSPATTTTASYANGLWDNNSSPPTTTNTAATTTANTSLDPSPESSSSQGIIEQNHASEYPPLPDTTIDTDTSPNIPQFGSSSAFDVMDSHNFDWTFPDDFNWSSVQPIFATTDLIYGHLNGTIAGAGAGSSTIDQQQQQQPTNGTGSIAGNTGLESTTGTEIGGGVWGDGLTGGTGMGGEWQFEGDFGGDTVWNLLNNFHPTVGLLP
ncbi:OMPdecase-domain-containing protein [Cladorrhinum sp. PSN259]|nr:OMPdecase-domain-containing protein [Cladorrhinum sp. PSN259]